MDSAVALVQAYLQVNGYFTVAEYPVLGPWRRDEPSSAMGRYVLGVRFPTTGRQADEAGRSRLATSTRRPDPVLLSASGEADWIVAEVYGTPGGFDRPSRDPRALQAVLTQYGCCTEDAAPDMVRALFGSGRARTPGGRALRMVVFGSAGEEGPASCHAVPMRHVMGFLHGHLHRRVHWQRLDRSHAHARRGLMDEPGRQHDETRGDS
ncbi:MAG: hypothetical protein ACQEXJ_24210 [Myxococcota bacterium]